MPMVSLLAGCPSEAAAAPRPASSAAPLPMILRKSRLLAFPMVSSILRSVRQFPGHHDTRTDGGAGSQTDHSGGQRVRSLALVLQIDRRIAVEGGRLVDLDLVGDGGLEEQV